MSDLFDKKQNQIDKLLQQIYLLFLQKQKKSKLNLFYQFYKLKSDLIIKAQQMRKDDNPKRYLFGPFEQKNKAKDVQIKQKSMIFQSSSAYKLDQNQLTQIMNQNQNKFKLNRRLLITKDFCHQCFQKISIQAIQSKAKIFKVSQSFKRSTIIKQIQHIKFHHLRVLVLGNCEISNIQLLHTIDMSGLRYLYLRQNLITNVKSLVKCFSQQNPIIEMNLDQNPIGWINQRQWVRKLNFSKKDIINRFRLANMKTKFETFEDFTDFVPFQLINCKNLKSIDMANQPFKGPKVKQPKLFNILNEIFPNAKISNSKSSLKTNTFNHLFGVQPSDYYNQQKYFQKGYDYRYNQDNDPYNSRPEQNIICCHFKNNMKKVLFSSQEQLSLLINRQFFSNRITFFTQQKRQVKINKKTFQILKNRLRDDFQYNQLCITNQFYTQIFSKVYKDIKESSIQLFEIQNCNKTTILKQIKNIQFTELKTLNLRCSNIKNVQPISLINCKKIQFLNLTNNNISIVKSLVKCFGVNNPIVQLKLDRNKIASINDRQWMRKILFKKQEMLGTLMVTKKQHQNPSTIFQDFTYFIPFQLVQYNKNSKFSFINIDMACQYNRVDQPKLFKMLNQIFPNCNKKNSRSNKQVFETLFGIF